MAKKGKKRGARAFPKGRHVRPEARSAINELLGEVAKGRESLIEHLHVLNDHFGALRKDHLAALAQKLGLAQIDVYETATFYAHFDVIDDDLPFPAKPSVRVCQGPACRMAGSTDVLATTENGVAAPCQGACDKPPAMITGRTRSDAPHLSVGDVDTSSVPYIAAELEIAGLRGMGGAGFPVAQKWKFLAQDGRDRVLVVNADEGEPGTFKDRVILTEQPDLVFEGMTVAGFALGAEEGLLYLRAEYEYLLDLLEKVLAKRRSLGMLGDNICGREGFNFDIRIQLGAGAYICGEESALIESLEGKRGAPRDRPPFPVQRGYMGQPTAVNNVETLCCAARVMEKGADWFAAMGTKDSTGTKLLSVSGDCECPGVYEIEYGLTVDDLLQRVGAEDAQAVQMGGPSGQCLAPKDFGRTISFEDLPTGGSVMTFGPGRDLLEIVRQFTEFFVEESCGWCVPCRVGTTLLEKILDKVIEGRGTQSDLDALRSLGNTVKTMSRCGLGQTAANPVLTTLQNFSGLYADKITPVDFLPAFDLKQALQEAATITGRTAELEDIHL